MESIYIKKYTNKNSHSLSKFEISKDSSIFIKKFYHKPDLRAFNSIKKQIFFKKRIYQNFKILTPKVKNFSEDNFFKNKFIEMEFIDGLSGDDIFFYSEIYEVSLLKNFFLKFFEQNFKTIKWIKIKKNIILDKIYQVQKNIKIKELKNLNRMIIKKINNNYKSEIIWPSSYCHGDLTLGNIIIKKNEIYLIDFLETYNDGVVQDFSKIIQEIYLGWTSRFFTDHYSVRINSFYEKIWPLNLWKNLNSRIKDLCYLESFINLSRIIPYIKSKDYKTIEWIYKSYTKLNKNRIFFK